MPHLPPSLWISVISGSDRRDAVRLALTHRAGLLTPIRVPSPAEEAVRDLVRARGDLLDDRKRMQQPTCGSDPRI